MLIVLKKFLWCVTDIVSCVVFQSIWLYTTCVHSARQVAVQLYSALYYSSEEQLVAWVESAEIESGEIMELERRHFVSVDCRSIKCEACWTFYLYFRW